jgi:hypothetical protein
MSKIFTVEYDKLFVLTLNFDETIEIRFTSHV